MTETPTPPSAGSSRRQFLGTAGAVGAAIASASVLGTESAARAAVRTSATSSAGGRSVAVFGAGVAGLTAAMELAERGFQVTLYERKALGGKARSFGVPGSATPGHQESQAEHGFRFFPGFYHNLPDTMRRIPFPGNANGTWDNLTRATNYLGARLGSRPNVTIPFPFPLPDTGTPPWLTPATFGATVLSAIQSLGMVGLGEAEFFVQKGIVFVTSCDERRFGQWEKVSWNTFLNGSKMSKEYQTLFCDGLIRNLAAMRSSLASTNAVGSVGLATVWSVLGAGNEPGGSVDRVLQGATNDMLINPWIAHLRSLGVTINLGWSLQSFSMANGSVAAAQVTDATGTARTVNADYFLSAVPFERLLPMLDGDMVAADPAFAKFANLQNDWMNGLVFHLNKEVDITPGHVNYWDSPWSLTSISQRQFWKKETFSSYGDGTVRDNLSTIISDWDTPGMFNGKSAKESTPDEMAAEAWAQMKAHLNKPGKKAVLTDDMIQGWYLDDGITGAGTPQVANDEPLFVQAIGTWDDRPTGGTAIPNFFVAGDWLQTDMNVSTMESANEGGRQAVNALLDAAGYNGSKAAIQTLWVPPAFDAFKKEDLKRYQAGLPNIFDLRDPMAP